MDERRKRILAMLASGKISADEAEQLLDAMGTEDAGGEVPAGKQPPRAVPKYLRVRVESANNDNVNVRVPLTLVRAGMRLGSLIPPQALEKINSSMAQKGIAIDLNSIRKEDIEELLAGLADMEVNVDSKDGDTVRVFCE